VRGFFDLSRSLHAKPRRLDAQLYAGIHRKDSLGKWFFKLLNHPITESLNSSNSLLIPCFCALSSQKPAIHAGFLHAPKKIPCYFPCY
jgi:hypothetical protein